MTEIVPFREVVSFAIGGGWGADASEGDDTKVAVVRGTDFGDVALGEVGGLPRRFERKSKLKERILKDGDLLLEVSGGSSAKGQSTGRSLLVMDRWLARLDVPAIPASFCRLIRMRTDRVDPQYAYYALQDMHKSGRAFEYENRSTGISNFQFQHFLDAERVRLPSLSVQRAIAEALGHLDAKIELNRRISLTLEATAQAIFKSWFIDFEPVRAKARGESAESIGERLGMTQETLTHFPGTLSAAASDEVPTGWRRLPLTELTSYLNRGISPKYVESGGVLVLNQKCIRDQRVSVKGARQHDPAQRAIQGRELVVGDVLVNSTGVGTLGRVAQVMSLEETTIVDSHVTVVRADLSETTANYLGMALCNRQAEIEALGEGSTGQTELSRARLGAISILAPPVELLVHFDERTAGLRQAVDALERESQALAQTRDALLPRLLSGELQVSEEAGA